MNESPGTTIGDSVGSVNGTTTNGPTWVPGFVPPAPANQRSDAPTVNSPANAATGVGTSPTLDVHVTDPDGGTLTVTFFGRPLASGNYAQIGARTRASPRAQTTTIAWPNIGAGQTFQWYATVNDGTHTDAPAPPGPSTPPRAPTPSSSASATSPRAPSPSDTDTGNIIKGIDGTIFTTGDNVYTNGTASEFTNCYATTPWGDPSSSHGRIRSRATMTGARAVTEQPCRLLRLLRRERQRRRDQLLQLRHPSEQLAHRQPRQRVRATFQAAAGPDRRRSSGSKQTSPPTAPRT